MRLFFIEISFELIERPSLGLLSELLALYQRCVGPDPRHPADPALAAALLASPAHIQFHILNCPNNRLPIQT
jgi:hypothetical protein